MLSLHWRKTQDFTKAKHIDVQLFKKWIRLYSKSINCYKRLSDCYRLYMLSGSQNALTKSPGISTMRAMHHQRRRTFQMLIHELHFQSAKDATNGQRES